MSAPASPPPGRPTISPTRERGRQRVEHILAAASDVFAEKGIGAATMAEIAARSATHVGSLYRFFPTKEAVADALLERYVARVRSAMSALLARASALGPPSFGSAWLDMMLDLRADRALAVQLSEDPSLDGEHRRRIVADITYQMCEEGIRTVLPALAAPRAATVAQTLLCFGKMAIIAADGEAAGRPPAVEELRWIVSRYLADQAPR